MTRAVVATTVSLGMAVVLSAAFPAPNAGGQANADCERDKIQLLTIASGQTYLEWREASGWRDLRPLADSTKRFTIVDGALRLETQGDSYLVGRRLPKEQRQGIDAGARYLRFQVKIVRSPPGARLDDDKKDDSAFRLFIVFRERPLQALAYVWGGDALPVGTWDPGRKYLFGDFRNVKRKVIGQGESSGEAILTVEVDLLRDFRQQFVGDPPLLEGVAFQADTNALPASSLAYLWWAALYPSSLRACGIQDGGDYRGSRVWFR